MVTQNQHRAITEATGVQIYDGIFTRVVRILVLSAGLLTGELRIVLWLLAVMTTLDTGAVLVDTPGIREVGIFADPDAVAETFPEIEELTERCRFSDCAHQREPGCAVLAAVEDGTLDPARLANWRDLEAEAASSALRTDPVAYRRSNRQFGKVVKEFKESSRNKRR